MFKKSLILGCGYTIFVLQLKNHQIVKTNQSSNTNTMASSKATGASSAAAGAVVRRASCVVLLRKGRGLDLEVLMAQRNRNMQSFGGAFVFPGGVEESSDGIGTGSKALSPLEQSKRCGLRELFEEAGVLLTTSSKSKFRAKPVQFLSKEEKRAWQKRVHDDPKEFDRLLKEKNVVLATNALFHWITFITPVMEPKRFYTDFFVVDSHYEEEGLELDGGETVSLSWIAPKIALEKNAKGEMPFLPPQYYILSTLLKSGDTPAKVIETVSTRTELDEPLPILPHPVGMDDGKLSLAYPGDEDHCDYPGKKGSRH
jgi:nucleoside diphosphate-linked moiety X motif protein 19